MGQIWYAAFSNEFVETAREIFARIGKEVYVTVWNPELVPEMINRGVGVILARGATARRIRETVDLPVVEISIPFEDMVQTLIKATRFGSNIGVIGYNNLLSGLELLNPILNVNIRQVFAVDPEDTYRQIGRLKQDGVEVIVGGLLQTRYASEQGLPSVRLELSERSLSYACEEAEKLLISVRATVRRTEEFKTILNTTREKYIAMDKKGNITWMNQIAKGYLRNPNQQIYNVPLTEAFPMFAPALSALEQGQEIMQETAVIGDVDVLYDVTLINYGQDEILGAVIAFNDSGTITRREHRLRDKETKGFQATYSFKDIYGNSFQMGQCVQFAKKYAHADLTVLLQGESGSGKELFAQSIHNASSRKEGPFVAVNCAALPEGILESELFGYDEGAFTGARRSGKMGLFELAHNGTIFLDEIGEMPMSLQSRLLRVLQEKKVMRLGGDRVFSVNVRIIAATNKNLLELVQEHKFREDLFYRLNVLTLKIPPLRERREDIPDLVQLFIKESNEKYCLTPGATEVIVSYDWPGNARQLRHFLEKLHIICDSNVIAAEGVHFVINNYEPTCIQNTETIAQKEVTREMIIHAIDLAGGNRAKAAESIGVHRSTFWRYMKKYRIE